jgi:hypothetical protein
MKRLWLSVLFLGACAPPSGAADFEPPVRLKAGEGAIRVERPGYAAPCWADLKGNGKMCLLVGQFGEGKIEVYEHLGGAEFAPGEWLKAEGDVAEVPGVW